MLFDLLFSDMDRIWKYFMVLVLIEMTFFIYFYVIVFNHSTTISNEEDIKVKERGQDFVDEKTREKILYMTNYTVHSKQHLCPFLRNNNLSQTRYHSQMLQKICKLMELKMFSHQLTRSGVFMQKGMFIRITHCSYQWKMTNHVYFLSIIAACLKQYNNYHLLIIYLMFILKLTGFIAYRTII